jgi:hypothetical protein
MKKLLQILSIALGFAFAAGCSQAGSGELRVVDYGLYEASNESSISDTNSPTGEVRSGGTFTLVEQSDTIPAKLGNAFGFRFSIPKDLQQTQLRYVYSFPEIRNPATGRSYTSFESLGEAKGHGPSSGIFYNLTDPWELVPGKWTIQVFVNDRKLLERQFTLVKAD